MSQHELVTRDELAALVRAEIRQYCGSQKAFAKRARISESYLSDFLLGRRSAPAKILSMFGVVPAEMYMSVGPKVNKPSANTR